MSTFNGSIQEIPNIRVDNFEEINETCTIYFLSHCHSDHMRGLYDWAFQDYLIRSPDVFLYASPISIQILKQMYPRLESQLKELPINTASVVKFPHSNYRSLTITPLPAGHCPGSVMFLFETDITILYTGDFRVNAIDLEKYKGLYCLDKLKKIDKIYLDTTFLRDTHSKLPTRQESLDSICNIIKEWINKSKEHIVQLLPSAKYGYEFLFVEISKRFEMPIHVNSDIHRIYSTIPDMDGAITIKSSASQIHASCGNKFNALCNHYKYLRKITLSVLWWSNKNMSKSIVWNDDEYFRVCYSLHASLEEIKQFLSFLKPTEVEPCVLPVCSEERETMRKLLNEIMLAYKTPLVLENDVKLFNLEDDAEQEGLMSTNDELDDVLDSPPRNFKRMRLWLSEDKSHN